MFLKYLEILKSHINFARVFHGIRFKVRGLIVGRQLIFFFYRKVSLFLINRLT